MPVKAADADLVVRLKTGTSPDPRKFFTYGDAGQLIETDFATWETLRLRETREQPRYIGWQGPVTVDRDEWTPWSGEVRIPGARTRLPSSRYLQVQVEMTSENPREMVRLDSVRIELLPLLAPSLLGEVGLVDNAGEEAPTGTRGKALAFDRTLWGRQGLWLRSGPSYHPNPTLYSDCPYAPREPNDLTDAYGGVIRDFVDSAVAAGTKVYFQIDGVRPTGMRQEDVPRLPNGMVPSKRMADTGSLASAAIRTYNGAYVKDLIEAYPNITGIKPDWPEYPCYKLDEAFQDFSPHVGTWANDRGIPFADLRNEVGRFYDFLHGGLTNRTLEDFARGDRLSLLRKHPAVMEWLRLKAALSVDLLRDWRARLDEAGGMDKELVPNAFMPPYNLLTGFDFAAAAPFCTAISPKLFTMHWTVIVEFWSRTLMQNNPGLDEALLVRALAHFFEFDAETRGTAIADFHYPEPDEPHPVSDALQARRIEQALSQAGGACAITPIVHGYGPPADFNRRFRVAVESPTDGVWINRYGYLSDQKLEAVSEIWAERGD